MSALKLGLLALGTVSSLLAGCYGSNEVKDGQSHWLERCSEASDCEDGQLCACGVCTIECDDPAPCGGGSLCANVELSQCDVLSSVPERVCLSGCSEDADCDASGIECRAGACVSAGTLIEAGPGGARPDDVTTVIDLDLGGSFGETLGVQQFLLTDGAVIWVTEVAGEEDGYLLRMALESLEITLLSRTTLFDSSYRLEVQGDLLLYGAEDEVHAISLSDGAEWWRQIADEPVKPAKTFWATDSTSFYYAFVTSKRPHEVYRAPLFESAQHEVIYTAEAASIRALTLDDEHVYVEEVPDATPSQTRVRRVAKDGSDVTMFSASFREPRGFLTIPLAMFVHDDVLISDLGEHGGIQAHALADGERRILTESTLAITAASSARNGYVYFTESTNPAGSSEQMYLSRVELASGKSERLHATSSFAAQIAVAHGFLYWVEQGRLVRTPLSAVTD